MKYYEVSVLTNHACGDTVASVLFDFGCEGVATYDKQDLLDLIREGKTWDYVEENLLEADGNVVIVKGFFLDEARFSEIDEAVQKLKDYNVETGSLEVTGQWLDDADYADEWKKYYKTLIFDRLAIVPSWLPPERDRINVLIDPGAAFGTGSHETTGMCISLMQRIDLAGKSVIDLGCGSAILGMSALKLGAKNCVFVDVDEMALGVSRSNVALNGLSGISEFYCGDIRDTAFRADIMFANITADVLCFLSAGLGAHIESGGILILSGIIDREFDRVRTTFENLGFCVREHRKEGDWHALLTERA